MAAPAPIKLYRQDETMWAFKPAVSGSTPPPEIRVISSPRSGELERLGAA